MTIANQLAVCLASIESAAASLKTFSLETKDQQAKQMFQQLAQTMDHSVQQLKGRLDYVMQEEPQYRNEIGGTYSSTTWTQGGGAQTGQTTGGYGTTTGTGGGLTFGGTTGMGGTTMGGNTMRTGSTTMGQGTTTSFTGGTGSTFGNSTMMTDPTTGTGTTTGNKNSSNKQKKNNKSF